jgi:hypothetical protein
MYNFNIISAVLIFFVAVIFGIFPFIKKATNPEGCNFPIGEALASGVFLGAGLIHMLGDSANDFFSLKVDYPYPFMIAGVTVLFFLWMEHIGGSLAKNYKGNLSFMAIMTTVMLSIHSFLAGAALGVSPELSVAIIVLLAIIAHKWAASLALSIVINKSNLKFFIRFILFFGFVLMAPLGVLFGAGIQAYVTNPYIEPTITSIAAGTFIYMGTLHGLERSILIKDCCNTKEYTFVIIGFALMAIVAIWA